VLGNLWEDETGGFIGGGGLGGCCFGQDGFLVHYVGFGHVHIDSWKSGLIAGTVRPHSHELDEQVRWSPGAAGFGLAGDFDPLSLDFAAPWEEITSPIIEVADGIVQSRELCPVPLPLAADLPEGHPGGLIVVFQEDGTQFKETSLIGVGGREIVDRQRCSRWGRFSDNNRAHGIFLAGWLVGVITDGWVSDGCLSGLWLLLHATSKARRKESNLPARENMSSTRPLSDGVDSHAGVSLDSMGLFANKFIP